MKDYVEGYVYRDMKRGYEDLKDWKLGDQLSELEDYENFLIFVMENEDDMGVYRNLMSEICHEELMASIKAEVEYEIISDARDKAEESERWATRYR